MTTGRINQVTIVKKSIFEGIPPMKEKNTTQTNPSFNEERRSTPSQIRVFKQFFNDITRIDSLKDARTNR